MIGILAAVTLSGLIGGEPADVEKDVIVLNDTKNPVEVRVDNGKSRHVDGRGAVSLPLSSFDEHFIGVTREDGHSFGRAFTFIPSNGFFAPPHKHHFCIKIRPSQVEILDSGACWSRFHRLGVED